MKRGAGEWKVRWSIWGPVAVCVLALVASAWLPRADVRSWGATLPADAPGLASQQSVRARFAPSWPVPALRRREAPPSRSLDSVWVAEFSPSWPVPALRAPGSAAERVPAASTKRPIVHVAAGLIVRERFLLRARAAVSLCLAVVLAAWVAGRPLVRTRRTVGRGVRLRRAITRLAERGVAHSRIAAESRVPRDTVRALLREAEREPLHRRA